MKINKTQRAAARHKKTEAVDSFLEHQKDGPVHSYPGSNKTLHRSGVVVRNDKSVGHEAMQRARETIDKVSSSKIERPASERLADRAWFEKNRAGVERVIGEKIRLDKRQILGKGMPTKNPQVQREEMPGNARFIPDHYQPPVDDDEPDYVPLSER